MDRNSIPGPKFQTLAQILDQNLSSESRNKAQSPGLESNSTVKAQDSNSSHEPKPRIQIRIESPGLKSNSTAKAQAKKKFRNSLTHIFASDLLDTNGSPDNQQCPNLDIIVDFAYNPRCQWKHFELLSPFLPIFENVAPILDKGRTKAQKNQRPKWRPALGAEPFARIVWRPKR